MQVWQWGGDEGAVQGEQGDLAGGGAGGRRELTSLPVRPRLPPPSAVSGTATVRAPTGDSEVRDQSQGRGRGIGGRSSGWSVRPWAGGRAGRC